MRFCLVSELGFNGRWTRPENGIRGWLNALGGEHRHGPTVAALDCPSCALKRFDVIMLNLTVGMFEPALRILDAREALAPHAYLVARPEGTMYRVADFSPLDQARFVEVLDRVNLVVAENEWAFEHFENLTDTPVEYQTNPVPIQVYRDLQARPATPPVIELGGALTGTKGGLYNALALRLIRREIPDVRAVVSWQPPDPADELAAYERLGLAGVVEFRSFREWPEYLAQRRDVALGLHLDTRVTWGRFVIDCIGQGQPVVGSDNDEATRLLWYRNRYRVHPWDVRYAAHEAVVLLTDRIRREDLVRNAQARLEDLGLAPTRERFLGLLDAYGYAGPAWTPDRARLPEWAAEGVEVKGGTV